MKAQMLPLVFALLFGAHQATATRENPISRVIQLVDDLAAKINADGEAADKAFKEYFEWCDDTSKNGENEVKTAQNQKVKLQAKIAELSDDMTEASSRIEELVAATTKASGELSDATAIRKKEASDFATSEAELVDGVSMLSRAIDIISREMAKNPAAFAQIKPNSRDLKSLLQSLAAVTEAAAFSTADQHKLLALVQSQQGDQSEDSDLGAPAASVYQSQSGGIVDTLEDMKEKAEGQLSDLRKAETNAKQNFAMLKQSLEDKTAADTKEMQEQQKAKAEAEEGKAAAEGDLDTTVKTLEATTSALATARSDCITLAGDHQESQKSRLEELAVITTARKILTETTGGAQNQAYSLLQVVSLQNSRSRADIVVLVKRLAEDHHSAALAQLASRISAVMRYGSAGGADPFAKVKGLIVDMIAKLEGEANADADEKAFCDEQMSKTEAKKAELEDDQGKLRVKIEQATAKSTDLKAEVTTLQAELAKLAKQQSEMDRIRREESGEYVKSKADLELGLSGLQRALSLLRDYYATAGASFIESAQVARRSFLHEGQPAKPQMHKKADGAGGSIIGILEVAESDLSKNLASVEAEESDAQAAYDKSTQENTITKTEKDQAVKYKTQEFKGLDKAVGDLSGDLATVETELGAVNEYYGEVKDRCIAKPEKYEQRKERREAEIAGLKQALDILENESAFVQGSRRGNLRGAVLAAAS